MKVCVHTDTYSNNIWYFFCEGIKGLILGHCGKLNSTHPGKLRQPQQPQQPQQSLLIVHCGSKIFFEGSCSNVRAAAMHKMEGSSRTLRQLVHCGSKFFFSLSLSSFSDVCVCVCVVYLVDCGSWIAAVPQ